MMAKGKVKEFTDEEVRKYSEHVYRQRLGEGDTKSMIAKDGDNGEKLRNRSKAYDQLSRCYLRAFQEFKDED